MKLGDVHRYPSIYLTTEENLARRLSDKVGAICHSSKWGFYLQMTLVGPQITSGKEEGSKGWGSSQCETTKNLFYHAYLLEEKY